MPIKKKALKQLCLHVEHGETIDPDTVAMLFETFGLTTTSDAPTVPEKSSADAGATHSTSTLQAACEYCGRRTVILEDGNYVCTSCNTLVERYLDHSAEWRCFSGDDAKGVDPTRCGPPANDLLPCGGSRLTAMGSMRACISSRMISKYQVWNSMSYKDRALYQACDLMTSSAARSNLAHAILEEAKNMYKRVIEKRITRGNNRIALIAACVYMACKTNRVPRSIREIADMFNIQQASLTRSCKVFFDITQLHVACSTPMDFVNRFCSQLNTSDAFLARVRHIVATAEAKDLLSEFTPPSAVAGCILLCKDLSSRENGGEKVNLSRKQVAQTAQLSAVTIAKCYKHLCMHRAQLGL